MEADTSGRQSHLPSNTELQQHMSDTAAMPSVPMLDPLPEGGPHADQTSEAPIGDEQMARVSSYKSPIELLSAPSRGKVTIAGRRLDTGELVQPEVIHLQDYPSAHDASIGGASGSSATSPAAPHTPAATSAHTAAAATPSSSPGLTIQETTKTSQQVYVTHAAVAAAAAAAGGLVGGAHHLDVRTSANVAELAVDPAAVVDFDSPSPTSTTTAAAPSAFSNDGSAAVSSSSSAGGGADSHPVPAVLPEDKQDVAATLQRLRSAGQLQGPSASASSIGPAGQTSGQAVNTEDLFIGAGSTGLSPTSTNTSTDVSTSTAGVHGQMPSSFSTAPASAAGHPSAQGVSAGTAAPARAGYPDPVVSTAAEGGTTAAEGGTTAADPAGLQAGMQPVSGSSSSLLAVHDAAAHAAAVAGALAHIGTHVGAAAAMAETATQPAQAVEAAAAAAAATSSYDEGTSPATSTAARVGSLQQQHTLADFLLDEHVEEHLGGAGSPPQHSSSSAHAVSTEHQVDLSVGTAAAEDELEVLLDVGRSTRLLSADGRVAQAAAVVPHEAVAAIQASSETPEEARSPRHPSLRQLSMSRQQGASSSSSTQQDEPPGSLPYGLTVADIVAATVASEERRFRVVSPRGSGGPVSPHSGTGSNFFTASSGSTPSTPRGEAAAASPAVERSSSPLSASATRAIFDSVQLAVQQQQQQDQLAQAVMRSGSLSATPAQQAGDAQPAPGAEDTPAASTTGQMASAGSGDSTATSSRPSSADSSVQEDSDGSLAASGVGGGAGTASPAGMDVTQQNAKVMQDMLLQEEAAAAGDAVPAPRASAAARGGSSDSAASVCGDSYVDQAGALSSSKEPTEQGSHPTSISSAIAGDKLAAAVAAGMADPVGAAAAGTDVAATAAPAFPSVLFGSDAMPVDVAATPRSFDSSDTHTSSLGIPADDMSPQNLSTAAALASAALTALSTAGSESDAGLQDPPAVTADAALLRVVDATSSAVISTASAGTDAPAAAAAAAAAAATEMHAASPDPAAAAADAAMLVVDAASTVPGLLEPSDVASAAAAAGAAAAAAATPGMDSQAAAVACSFAAAAPLAPPEEVGAAAASALAGLQDSTGTAAAVADSGAAPSAGGLPHLPPAFAPMSTDMHAAAGSVNTPAQASTGVQHSLRVSSPGPTADLDGVLPILAPAGQVGDAISISSLSLSTDTPPSEPPVASTSLSTAQLPGAADGAEPTSSSKGTDELPGWFAGTAEVLNREGLSKMYDPLIVQLALASSVPLEGLGLDESDFLTAHGSSAATIAAAGRELTQSGSFGKAAGGILMLQPHPAASLAASTSLGGGPPEGGAIMSHLAAAEQALSQLDTQLQRQRTDSINLGAGRSAALGELDDLSSTATGGPAAAEAPSGPDGVDAGSGA